MPFPNEIHPQQRRRAFDGLSSLAYRRLAVAVVLLPIAVGCATSPPQRSAAPTSTGTLPGTTVGASPSTAAPGALLERVRPPLVYVQTAINQGSGFVYDERHVVTNAHVVRPFSAARLVFEGRREVAEARVVGWDLIGDLALLETDVPPAAVPAPRGSAEVSASGDRVYLVGFPLADRTAPNPRSRKGSSAGRPCDGARPGSPTSRPTPSSRMASQEGSWSTRPVVRSA